MPRKPLRALSLHHIDTSVFIKHKRKDERHACQKYLQRVGYNYCGAVSLPVLGEIMLTVLKTPEYKDRTDFLEWFAATLKVRAIEEYVPSHIGKLMRGVRNADKRVDPVDSQIVACAIEAKADALVTLDSLLLDSQQLQRRYGLRIAHPKELV